MTVVNATSLQQALEALHDHPGARLVQGGTDLMVEVNFNRTTLHDVVALRRVNELKRWHVSEDSQTIRLGAGIPYAEMERSPLCHHLPALAQAARTVGSPQ
ncbi:MAG: FAD binding domain-containing protein, partial [Ilumatobacteraceae bacterium]